MILDTNQINELINVFLSTGLNINDLVIRMTIVLNIIEF